MSDSRLKVLSIVGARPQFVKLAPVAAALSARGVDHVIVHTGQHYDFRMSESFFQEMRIPRVDVQLGIGSGTHGAQTGGMLRALDPVLTEQAPSWVLVYGDTNSTLAGALSASKLHLPVAHIEAGLRSHNRHMPEEINRVLADHAADLCLAPSQVAMDNLSSEGLGGRSLLVGDVMTDVCLKMARAATGQARPVLDAVGTTDYVIATIHRAENTDSPSRLAHLVEVLADLPFRVVLPVHPRLRDRTEAFGIAINVGAISPVEPLGYGDMVAAMMRARGVITDSGGLQKEAFLLETPCITVRSETEWPETLQGRWNVLNYEAHGLDDMLTRKLGPRETSPYGDGRASEAIAAALLARVLDSQC